jgi:hypothetical protein
MDFKYNSICKAETEKCVFCGMIITFNSDVVNPHVKMEDGKIICADCVYRKNILDFQDEIIYNCL